MSKQTWLERDEFLVSIPKDDAREILQYTSVNSHCVDDDNPNLIRISIQELQQMIKRARRRVYIEFAIWCSIIIGVTATVSVIIAMR
jgi:hypothetical protein